MSRIGIKEVDIYFFGSDSINFKRDILLFDKIIVIEEALAVAREVSEALGKGLNYWDIYNFNNQNIEFLEKSGHLEIMSINSFANKFENTKTIKLLEEKLAPFDKEIQSIPTHPILFNFINRIMATVISRETENDAIPILQESIKRGPSKDLVLNFVLSDIPEPSDVVPWEQIFDFKNDPDTVKKYYRLMNWVTEVSKGNLTHNEITEKYKELLFEYTDRFRIHKMKSKVGVLEIISTVVSKAASLKFDEITESLFSIKKKNLELMEAELSFPGKEVAFIHKTQQQFKKNI